MSVQTIKDLVLLNSSSQLKSRHLNGMRGLRFTRILKPYLSLLNGSSLSKSLHFSSILYFQSPLQPRSLQFKSALQPKDLQPSTPPLFKGLQWHNSLSLRTNPRFKSPI